MSKYLPLCFILAACGQSPQNSEPKWAHSSAESSWGTISALVDYLDLGFTTNYDKLRVCVQGTDSLQGPSLLLETRLSYAAWLQASGHGTQHSWNHFEFEALEVCDPRDTSFGSVVILETEGRAAGGRNPGEAFSKASVTCQKSGHSVRCSSGSTTFGWGGPASMSYSYFDPKKWESISNRNPASVRLSPYVKWRSLEADLQQQKSLTKENKKIMMDRYQALAAKGASATFSELSAYMNLLSDAGLVAASDGSFQKVMQDFQTSGVPTLNQEYIPHATSFHVLLHEVGHQFGMNHADNPLRDSETGYVVESQQQNGQWVTSEAAMAYGEAFLYLTADDRAGALDMGQKTLAFLKSRR